MLIDNHMQKKISDFVAKLQSQTHLPYWALNHEMVIYALAVNSKPTWGEKAKLLNFLITIANKMMLSDVLIFSLGLLRAFALWRAVKKKKKNIKINNINKFTHIFFSFKVSSENYLYADYVKQTEGVTLKIDSVTLDGMQYFDQPKFTFILALLFKYAFGCTAKLKMLQSEINLNVNDFLTVSALNIGIYTFYRSYWNMLKSKKVKEIAFITIDPPLYACIDEAIPTVFFEHGLMFRSLLIPKVDRFYTLTYDEEKYLKKSIPHIKVGRKLIKYKINKTKNNNIMILSPNLILSNFCKIQEFMSQPIFKNFQFINRPTPQATESELHLSLKELPSTILDDTTIPLYESIEKWNPKFIISGWMSTGLATALDYECLPISLYDPNIDDKWIEKIYPNDYWNTIYPVKSRILFWPRDQEIIKKTIVSQIAYENQIKILQPTGYSGKIKESCYDI
ncbi:MAG: hypothetical protein ACD_46C00253G0002 [uncultured bacterium]|nr:MAG: hypothetical protein ACD_46C00253G0002 [uncultured bacterium]OGT47564.1 MAG: hypothetical protein A3E83_06675 [Gammaproteobacteria bacterium RIFCSPHIGHO2_12_FULL_41_20]HLB43557.1 hypothetical protein [Gammaproteobacteria bacterium]